LSYVLNPEDLETSKRLDLASQFLIDPVAAHSIIFAKQHVDESAGYHAKLIKRFHSNQENVLALCFRGSAKSTIAEETIALLAVSGQTHNNLIVGDSYLRAVDRLKSIRRHLQFNQWLRYLFGDTASEVEGDMWQESRIELKSESIIWAAGQGQALRGTKHGAHRPDYLFVDDLENQDNTNTALARLRLSDWYFSDLIPALDAPGRRRIRVAATPLHPESLAVRLSKLPSYELIFVPAIFTDAVGVQRSSWPSRFPLATLMEEKEKLIQAGKARSWATEYLCEAVNPDIQLFKAEHIRYTPLIRTWEPVYICYDPARTDKETSATTGIVAASFIGRKIIIWEARGERILPDQIVRDIFNMHEVYSPIAIGIEKDGLEQFIEQPLRHEQVKRGVFIPVRFVKAPKGKDEFIGRLHPLFVAGDIVFAGDEQRFRGAQEQILSFPVGNKDILNAMAYLFMLRGGIPVYPDISSQHIVDGSVSRGNTFSLAINASAFGTTTVLFQYIGEILYIEKDWISEEQPGICISSFIEEAKLYTGKSFHVIFPPYHHDVKNSIGLLSSLKGVSESRKGGDIIKGRDFIRQLARSEARGSARVLIGDQATWTRRAMTGGFVQEPGKLEPREGLYRTLMEGLEAAIAPASYQHQAKQNIEYTEHGTPYNSARAL
jgi:hypothetical protein